MANKATAAESNLALRRAATEAAVQAAAEANAAAARAAAEVDEDTRAAAAARADEEREAAAYRSTLAELTQVQSRVEDRIQQFANGSQNDAPVTYEAAVAALRAMHDTEAAAAAAIEAEYGIISASVADSEKAKHDAEAGAAAAAEEFAACVSELAAVGTSTAACVVVPITEAAVRAAVAAAMKNQTGADGDAQYDEATLNAAAEELLEALTRAPQSIRVLAGSGEGGRTAPLWRCREQQQQQQLQQQEEHERASDDHGHNRTQLPTPDDVTNGFAVAVALGPATRAAAQQLLAHRDELIAATSARDAAIAAGQVASVELATAQAAAAAVATALAAAQAAEEDAKNEAAALTAELAARLQAAPAEALAAEAELQAIRLEAMQALQRTTAEATEAVAASAAAAAAAEANLAAAATALAETEAALAQQQQQQQGQRVPATSTCATQVPPSSTARYEKTPQPQTISVLQRIAEAPGSAVRTQRHASAPTSTMAATALKNAREHDYYDAGDASPRPQAATADRAAATNATARPTAPRSASPPALQALNLPLPPPPPPPPQRRKTDVPAAVPSAAGATMRGRGQRTAAAGHAASLFHPVATLSSSLSSSRGAAAAGGSPLFQPALKGVPQRAVAAAPTGGTRGSATVAVDTSTASEAADDGGWAFVDDIRPPPQSRLKSAPVSTAHKAVAPMTATAVPMPTPGGRAPTMAVPKTNSSPGEWGWTSDSGLAVPAGSHRAAAKGRADGPYRDALNIAVRASETDRGGSRVAPQKRRGHS